METIKRKGGRPKQEAKVRDSRISAYITEQDAIYIRELAKSLDMSTSELVTAILERLCIGGFSALVFAKLGWQFANALPTNFTRGFYFGVRPLPPLIGKPDDPELKEFRAFLQRVGKEHELETTRKEQHVTA